MKARYQYRFYPTDQQRQSLARLFGCVRVVWNDALVFCKQSEKLPGYSHLSAMLTRVLTILGKTTKFANSRKNELVSKKAQTGETKLDFRLPSSPIASQTDVKIFCTNYPSKS